MHRTTIRLPIDLLDHAKECARDTGRTLTRLIEDAVRAELVQHTSHQHGSVREGVVRLNLHIADLQHFLSAIPDRDSRPSDEILGYDAYGLPG